MNTNSDAPQTLYLGLDVHKAETVIAILENNREAEPRHYGSITTSQHALERAMRRIAKNQKCKLADLHVCYEASGCGFWIARRLLQMGVRCDVIAPSLIPIKSGDRIKTDKRDAMKLAKNLRSNDLVPVNIPDSTDARHAQVTRISMPRPHRCCRWPPPSQNPTPRPPAPPRLQLRRQDSLDSSPPQLPS